MKGVLDQIFGQDRTTAADNMLKKIARAREQAEAEGLGDVPPMPVDMNSEWLFITPLKAQMLLENMIPNRKVSPAHLDRIKDDMKKGQFHTTHQGVAILENGKTADGQHRLRAIVETGLGQWILVTYGLSQDAMMAVDRGRMRTLADHLHLVQKGHAIDVASAARVVAKARYAWEESKTRSQANDKYFSHYDLAPIVEHFIEDGYAEAMVNNARTTANKAKIRASVGGAFYYLASSVHGSGVVEEFMSEVRGHRSDENSAAGRLRTKMTGFSTKKRKINQMEMLAHTIKSFTNFVKARSTGEPDNKNWNLTSPGTLPKIPSK